MSQSTAFCAIAAAAKSALVSFQKSEPRTDVSRMIRPRIKCDTELRAKESRADFGDKFFGGIDLVAKMLSKFPIAAMSGACEMTLMPTSA